MAGKKILPDAPRLLQLLDKPGMTHQKLADKYGTTRQAVTSKLRGVTSPRYQRREWPWEVQSRHKTGWLYDAISFYMQSRAKEQPLTDRQRSQVAALMDAIDSLPGDYVIDYFPDTATGFRFRPRRPSDTSDSLIATP